MPSAWLEALQNQTQSAHVSSHHVSRILFLACFLVPLCWFFDSIGVRNKRVGITMAMPRTKMQRQIDATHPVVHNPLCSWLRLQGYFFLQIYGKSQDG